MKEAVGDLNEGGKGTGKPIAGDIGLEQAPDALDRIPLRRSIGCALSGFGGVCGVFPHCPYAKLTSGTLTEAAAAGTDGVARIAIGQVVAERVGWPGAPAAVVIVGIIAGGQFYGGEAGVTVAKVTYTTHAPRESCTSQIGVGALRVAVLGHLDSGDCSRSGSRRGAGFQLLFTSCSSFSVSLLPSRLRSTPSQVLFCLGL